MTQMIRQTVAPLIGVGVGVVLVAIVQMLTHQFFAAPVQLDLSNPEAVQTFMATVPMGAKIGVVVSWGVGMFGGGWTARRIAPGLRWVYSSVIALLLAFTCMNFVSIPHPVWMIMAPFLLAGVIWWFLDRETRADQ